MYLRVDTTVKANELVELDDTSDFWVQVEGSTEVVDIDESIAGAGRMVGDAAWISVNWLRAQAEGRVSDTWSADLQQFLDRLGREGRLNDDRSYIQAPVRS
jgi:hypothetical protein